MDNEKQDALQRAHEHFKAGRKDEAVALLYTIDSPAAREALKKLNASQLPISVDKPSSRGKSWKIALIIILIIVGVLAAISFAQSAQDIAAAQTEQARIFDGIYATQTARP